MVDAEGLKKLRANGGDTYTLVSFWATWCGSCVAEFADMQDTLRMYGDRGFNLVTVSANAPDEKDGVQKFLERKHATSRNLLFASDDTAELQKAFDPHWESAVPYTVLIAPGGQVLFSATGSVDMLGLRRKILASVPAAYIGFQKYWVENYGEHKEILHCNAPSRVRIKRTSAISLSRRPVRSPEDRIAEDCGKRRVFEQIRMMAHKDIDVSGLVALIGPDHRMIAHLDLRIRVITVLTYAGKHVNIGSRRLVPCVPFLVHNRKWARHAPHRGMRLVFDGHHAVGKCGDVLLEPDAAHEL
jgi:peroxiredoxin